MGESVINIILKNTKIKKYFYFGESQAYFQVKDKLKKYGIKMIKVNNKTKMNSNSICVLFQKVTKKDMDLIFRFNYIIDAIIGSIEKKEINKLISKGVKIVRPQM